MKIKIIIVILAVACVGLAVGLLAVKKQGEEQHVADASSIVDFSNQVVNARVKIDELNQVNLTYSNDVVSVRDQAGQLSNSLAAANVAIANGQDLIAGAQSQITNLNTRISSLETENRELDQRASDLTNSLAQLNSQIEETRNKLAASDNNNNFLQQELQKQMAQKAELEHKFNDLDELHGQVKKVKNDLFVARRVQLMKNDLGQRKGAQLLIQHSVPTAPAAPAYGLNVEVGSDGSVRVIPPAGAATNAPAQ